MNIEKIVKEAIKSIGQEKEPKILNSSLLGEDLGFDSLDIIDLECILEEEFDVGLDFQADFSTTVQDVIDKITKEIQT